MDKSMAVALGAKRKPADVGPTDLYNPWWDTLKKGYGTLMYKGKWNLFDQIVFTGNFSGLSSINMKSSAVILCSKKKGNTKVILNGRKQVVYG